MKFQVWGAALLLAAIAVLAASGDGAALLAAFVPPSLPSAAAIVGSIGELVKTLAAVAVYCAPAIIAHRRKHPDYRTIAFINLALGWTFAGWVVALYWTLRWPEGMFPRRLPCPRCAEAILPAARVCPHCITELPAGWATGAEIVPLGRRAS